MKTSDLVLALIPKHFYCVLAKSAFIYTELTMTNSGHR